MPDATNNNNYVESIPDGYVAFGYGLWARPDYLERDPARRLQLYREEWEDFDNATSLPNFIFLLDCSEIVGIHNFDYNRGGSEYDRRLMDMVYYRNLRHAIEYRKRLILDSRFFAFFNLICIGYGKNIVNKIASIRKAKAWKLYGKAREFGYRVFRYTA